jgi:hypothetical protein
VQRPFRKEVGGQDILPKCQTPYDVWVKIWSISTVQSVLKYHESEDTKGNSSMSCGIWKHILLDLVNLQSRVCNQRIVTIGNDGQ